MPIDPKLFKTPKTKEIMRSYYAPRYAYEYLQAQGLNLSAVCVDALQRAVNASRHTKATKAPELGHYAFKVDPELAKAFKETGLSLTEVCTKAILELYAELKAQRGK